jgi:hypothetical protein
MEKITPAPRGKFSLPRPIDVHAKRGDEQNNNETDEKPAALQSIKL